MIQVHQVLFIVCVVVGCVLLGLVVASMKKRDNKSSEEHCEFVSSRGLLKSCQVHDPDPVSGNSNVYKYNWRNLKSRAVVYINGSAITQFVEKVLPQITVPFVLVSGDSTRTIPKESLSEDQFKQFMKDRRLIHWFSQNAVVDHPKLTVIPLGMDYHTLSKKDFYPWGKKIMPLQQEALLKSIRQTAPPLLDRIVKCYSNFHFALDQTRERDRRNAKESIPENLVFYEPKQLSREQSWKNQCQYAFVISPFGNGLDCHRTWEALLLGCIPVMKKPPLVNLFDDLPVLIVNDWSDVTMDLLQTTVRFVASKQWNLQKLYLSYWTQLIYKKQLFMF